MDTLSSTTERMLDYVGIESSKNLLGNTVGDITFSTVIFFISLAVFALAQYITLSWLASLSTRTETDLDDVFIKIAKSFKSTFFFVVSLWIAVQFLNVYAIANSILTAILLIWFIYQTVVVIGILVEDVLFIRFAKDRDETTKSALHILANLAKGTVWVIGILLVMSNFGINITSLLAGAGIAGIAVAFALQGILGDLFSSFSLYFDKPFKVGDFIITGDAMGTVKNIGIKSTRIESLAGEEIVLSNQELTSAKIQNYKRMEERRVVFSLGILYETKKELVKKVPQMVKDIIESTHSTRFDRAHFKNFGASSLDFEVVYYVLDSDYAVYMDAQQEINLKLLDSFKQYGIEFAYPTQTVYVARASS